MDTADPDRMAKVAWALNMGSYLAGSEPIKIEQDKGKARELAELSCSKHSGEGCYVLARLVFPEPASPAEQWRSKGAEATA
ncbi:MAG: hypothetical protein AAF098_19025 [Pseudomonadota bacterium]